VRFDQDQYSALDQTGLADELRRRGIQRLFIGGLAQDVCVQATVLDACKAGFDVILVTEGTRPVTKEGGEKARKAMKQAGARLL
ncbi:MAG: isochorismatase family protein, partial [Bacteroidota bacterium]